jgi:hypothetical protein
MWRGETKQSTVLTLPSIPSHPATRSAGRLWRQGRGKKFLCLLTLTGISLLAFYCPVYAGGTYAGSVLLRSPSAKSIAMAEALSSVGADFEGVSAFHYNPAANAALKNAEISFMGQRGIAEDNFGSFFAGVPTERGTFAGSIFYQTVGDIDLINGLGEKRTVQAQRDVGLSINYAEEIFELLATGVSIKFLNSRLVESFSANAVALDIGIQKRLMENKASVGLAVLNGGSSLQYLETDEPLPLTIRAGASYKIVFENSGRLLAALDLVREKEEKVKEFIGIDYAWNVVAFRAGYKIGQDLGKYSGGIGFALGRC